MTTTTQLNTALDGRYRVEREIGAGGMAMVYLARDIKHDRHVALKVLRPELSAILGGERFLKEIRTTANLQHPHILPLHDSGEADGLIFYVMPFIDGESLRDRLNRDKQLPIDEAVRIAREVASALDYAHRRGVVHRDIKPENILLNDGQALVADFGIALAASSVSGTRMTETGMSLGTPHYMSPEQAMGEREITPRSDVYALGCVLYEMLLGEPPFTGPTAQAIVARVVTEEPRSLTSQRKTIPLHVEAAVHTALAKMPADRFATAADFSNALVTASYTSAMQATAHRLSASRASWIRDPRTLLTLGLATVLVAAAFLVPRRSDQTGSRGEVLRMIVPVQDSTPGIYNIGSLHGAPALSPDGRTIAYSIARDDTVALFIQPFDRFEARAVPGGGRMPVFSPDGKWIAFMRGSTMWKVPLTDGEAVRLGTIPASSWNISQPVWHANAQIYVPDNRDGVYAMPSAGGVPTLAVKNDSTQSEIFDEVRLAPDGRLLAALGRPDSAVLSLLDVRTGEVTRFPGHMQPPGVFVGDVLLFAREGQTHAARVNLADATPDGPAVPITDVPAVRAIGIGAGSVSWFDVMAQRTLRPSWVSRTGVVTPSALPMGDYRWPRISPDGRRIAIQMNRVIGVADLATSGRSLLTKAAGTTTEPVWFHDASRIVTSSYSKEGYRLVSRAADGGGAVTTLVGPTRDELWPTDIIRGDSLLLFYGNGNGDPGDLYVYNLRAKTQRRLAYPGQQRGGRFSPDGKWIAVETMEAGRSNVLAMPWPAADAIHVVSTEGGEQPTWSRDGRELFFRSGSRMMSVRVSPGTTWRATQPTPLFTGFFARDLGGDQSYDVGADGRFLMLSFVGEARLQMRVVRNLSAELTRRLDEAQR